MKFVCYCGLIRKKNFFLYVCCRRNLRFRYDHYITFIVIINTRSQLLYNEKKNYLVPYSEMSLVLKYHDKETKIVKNSIIVGILY